MILRPYQTDAIQETRDAIRNGSRAPLLVAPTGAGKTAIASYIMSEHMKRDGAKVVFVAHRHELIEQAARTSIRFGIPMQEIGEIRPGVVNRPSARLQIASTQTLRSRRFLPEASMVVFDEAHHYSSDDWSMLARHYGNTLRIGFTATPCRSDGRGMSPSFDHLVVVSSISELTAAGYLVPCRMISTEPLSSPNMSHRPVDAYNMFACGRKTVVFADFVENAYKFRDEFKEERIEAVVVHGKLSRHERAGALYAHERGAVLINCMVLTEGWDSPSTSCCILARGCGSISTYMQIGGRILRPYDGKKDAIFIDLTGRAYAKHGRLDDERTFSLDGIGIRSKGKVSKDSYCQICGCIECEHTSSSKVDAPVYTGSELTERYAGKRRETDTKRIETLAMWLAEERDRGYRRGAAFSKFLPVYGVYPTEVEKCEAASMSASIRCVKCSLCGKVSAKTYESLCGKCFYRQRTTREQG